MKTGFQPPIPNQRTLGGPAYFRDESQFRSETFPAPFEGAIVDLNLRIHFAPVASDELMENRPKTNRPTPGRKRTLPVIKATGRTITQAEIDDALDD